MSKSEIIELLMDLQHRVTNSHGMYFMCIHLEAMLNKNVNSHNPIIIELKKDVVREEVINSTLGDYTTWYEENDKQSRITNINRTIKRLQKEINHP